MVPGGGNVRHFIGVIVVLAGSGCQGTFRNDCYPNATCNDGLVCIQGICLNDSVDGGGSTGGGGGSTGGGGGGATGGGSTGAGGATGGGGGGTGGGGTPACVLSDCAVGQECIGTCVDADLVITPQMPPFTVGYLDAMVQMRIERADGGLATGIKLPLTVQIQSKPAYLVVPDGGVPVASNGNFSFPVRAQVGANGQCQALANFPVGDAGVEGGLDVTVDTTPPTVTVEVYPAPMRPASWVFTGTTASTFRRDEMTRVKVTAGESLSGVTVKVGDAVMNESASRNDCSCPPLSQGCYCFEAELWRPTLNGISATFPVVAGGADIRGVGFDGGVSVADGGNPSVDVTRLRWMVQPSGFPIRAAPVLDDEGTVYFGDARTVSTGVVYAYTPLGAQKVGWGGASTGAVTSLAFWRADAGATDDDVLFFNANNTDGGILSSVDVNGVMSAGRCDNRTGGGTSVLRTTDTAIALAPESNVANAPLAAVAHFSAATATTGALCMWNPSAGTATALQPMVEDTLAAPMSGVAQAIHNLLATRPASGSSTNIVNIGRGAGLTIRRRAVLSPNSFDFAAAINVPGIGSSMSLTGGGLSFTSAPPAAPGEFGPFAVSVNGLTGAGLVRVRTDSGSPQLPSSSIDFTEPASPSVVTRAGWAWAHSNGLIQSTDFSSVPGPAGTAFTGPVTASPVLTANARLTAQDRLYVVNTAGTLGSLRLSASSAMEWTGSVGLSSVSASPAFDCNRLAGITAKAATGVLYIASGGGALVAVIVDSPRLDTQARWPKYQRDAFNSGNTFLSFDNCP